MARKTLIKNYNDLSGCVVTDLNKLKGAPENAVKDAINFEFSPTDGVNVRKALDLEVGISGSDYNQLNSDLPLGDSKVQAFTFKGVLNQLDAPTHDIVVNTFDGKALAYGLGNDAQLADAVLDADIDNSSLQNSYPWTDIAWSPKLAMYVAVGYSSTYGEMMVSTDGEYWSYPKNFPDSIHVLTAIVWSEELEIFVGVGDNNNSIVSSDGINWTSHDLVMNNLTSLVWSPTLKLFVAISNTDSTRRCMTSPDGITWTARTIDLNKAWRSVTWSPALGLLVAVADGGTSTQRIATSPDGVTWTLRATPATDRAWKSICWSEEEAKFIAVGTTNYVLTSTNGTAWSESVEFTETTQHNQVIWSAELALFVSVSITGTYRAQTSPDGLTWTEHTVPTAVSNPNAVVWSPELAQLVAVSNSGTERVMTSTDGSTWVSSTVAELVNENPQDWIEFQGIPIGVIGASELAILFNTDATTYELNTTLGLGTGPRIRDFTGAYDGLAVDYNPTVMRFDTASYAGTSYTAGEDLILTSGANTRRFRIISVIDAGGGAGNPAQLEVDKSLGAVDTDFDGADTENYVGWLMTGASSGASQTITVATGEGLSDAHRYNLINQGWTQAYADTYAGQKNQWPNNTQMWFAGRDSSNNFSPTELDKISFGNSQAAKGHVLLNPLREWRSAEVPGVTAASVPNTTYNRGFTAIAKFGSRIALSGASIGGAENAVYISPILDSKIATVSAPGVTDLDFSEVFRFHQANDPTADIQNELLPDDGVVIPIAEAKRIHKLVSFHNSLLVIADNGVWAIAGIDIQTGFRTDDFSVYKIAGAEGCKNPRSVVVTKPSVFYWSDDGIYTIGLDKGTFIAANITINRVEKLYSPIDAPNKAAALGCHDAKNFKVYWAYNTTAGATYPELRNGLLVLDLKLNGFYPLKMQTDFADSGGDLSTYLFSINGFTQDTAFPEADGTTPLKLMIGEHRNNAGSADIKHSIMEFNNGGQDFYDFVTYRQDVYTLSDLVTPQEAYIDTWDDTLGDTTRSKQGIWAFVHMTKTEYGFEDLGGGALGALGVSSLFMQRRWDWNDSNAGGKWSTAREVYRHKRPYVPVDVNDTYDTGESIITTKNKMYGRGRALSLRFTAQAGKDAILLGFAIPYSVEDAP